jgi:hypothetical protein
VVLGLYLVVVVLDVYGVTGNSFLTLCVVVVAAVAVAVVRVATGLVVLRCT